MSFYVPYLLLYFHDTLGLSFEVGGFVIGGVAALAPPLSLMGGGLADRFGRRNLILSSLTAEAGALAVLALGVQHDSLPVILVGMASSQVCSSIGVPATIAYVGDSTSASNRTRGIAWVRIGINLGYSGGIAVGAVLLLFLPFWEMAAVAAFVVGTAAAFDILLLKSSARDRAVEVAVPAPLPSRQLRLGSTLRGVGQSIRQSAGTLRRNPILLQLGVACGLSYLMFQQLNYSISTFGLRDLALSYGFVGAALAVNGITCVVLPIRLPTWLARRAHTWVGAWGAAIIGIGLFMIGLDGYFRFAVAPVFIAAVFTMSVGECFATIPPYTLALNLAPEAERGGFAGAIALSTGMVASVSAIFAGAGLSAGPNPLMIWAILSAPAIPSVLLFGRLSSRIAPDCNRL